MRFALILSLGAGLIWPATSAARPPDPDFVPAFASLARDGTAAVLLGGDERTLKLRVRQPGAGAAFDRAVTVPEAIVSGQRWVVAEPGGGSRVLWVAERSDYSQVDPPQRLALLSTGPLGTQEVSPLLPAQGEARFSVAANADGQVVAAWAAGTAGGAATAEPGQAFAPVEGAVGGDPLVAIAPGGRALIASTGCLDFGSCPEVRERAADGSFGPTAALPIVPEAVAVASDGSAVVARATSSAVAVRRPPGGTWGAPEDLGPAPGTETSVAAGVASGGEGLVAFTATDGIYAGEASTLVSQLRADGSVASGILQDTCCQDPQVVVRDADGAAALVAGGGTLLARAPGEPLRTVLDDANGAFYSAAIGPDGLFVARTGSGDRAYAALFGGMTVPLGGLPARVPDVRGPARVPNLPVVKRAGHASVPVICPATATFNTCSGNLRILGSQERHVYALLGREGTTIELPVPRREKRVTLELDPVDGPPRRFTRRVTTGASACRVAPWALTLARAGASRVGLEDPPGAAGPAVVACTASRARRVLIKADATVGATNGHLAAIVTSAGDLHVFDLATGMDRARTLYSTRRTISRLLLSRGGAVVVADRLEQRVRVRAIDAAGDRLLDFAPGIDPASLHVAGDTATWTRRGKTRQATLSGRA